MAGLGSIYIYSCCSCYDCYRVAKAVIKVASSVAIGTTYNIVVGIANRISRIASKISKGFYRDSYKGYYGDYC